MRLAALEAAEEEPVFFFSTEFGRTLVVLDVLGEHSTHLVLQDALRERRKQNRRPTTRAYFIKFVFRQVRGRGCRRTPFTRPYLSLSGPQSRFGDKLLGTFEWFCPQNGTAVLKLMHSPLVRTKRLELLKSQNLGFCTLQR